MSFEALKPVFDTAFGAPVHTKENENANIDTDTPMGAMLKFGGESSKIYYLNHVLTPEMAKAHKTGHIHIHDLDFFGLTTTCCQIDIDKIFNSGFNTGHGHIRPPQDIKTYAALTCIVLQSNQNDQHGGQSIPNFDYVLAKGVKKTFKKILKNNILKYYDFNLLNTDVISKNLESFEIPDIIKKDCDIYQLLYVDLFHKKVRDVENVISVIHSRSMEETDRETFQAMESLVHNLNTMAGRAGAQVPFTSLNYGTDTTTEGRMVIRNILLATQKGLGHSETPIFPIQIFRLKAGVNMNPGDRNEDLFDLACKVSSKRLFPNFSFQDAPFNAKYYKEGRPETEISYMGCRSRVVGNVHDPEREITFGRGNLSFTSINLPRLAIENQKEAQFFYELDATMELVVKQLLYRYDMQKRRLAKHYPFLMGQHVWIDSEKLNPNDSVEEVLKHGTLAIGFVGLAECLKMLTGAHHGEDKRSAALGLEIVERMRAFCDKKAEEMKLNFSLIATPAESLAGRFLRIDRAEFGIIDGVTDKEYYTNSFHLPVTFKTRITHKIDVEAPYHALCNGGHISYIELDGCTDHNPEAMKNIIKYMGKKGIGYGSINHPVDSDPVCGYTGIIGDCCPKCGRKESEGPAFRRIRRITGYLVGELSRFNHGKLNEVKDRTTHA